ncbi:peptide chain release factor N(5)-glutamine methyltransferase [Foetidibacter luteolus]|uniref:peptide chain release factor N(5)-glutamine methyltransferase n=1 Tax=Foetidibacter luteolus TaxID=2608880 RepID=UPI00129B0268|nr:peptide chain release factor N(5)-glutamine methyltransferase [Foetidibacter luteolus]
MTIQQAYQQLLSALFDLYDDREAANIANLVIEHVTGQRKIDRLMNKLLPLSGQQQQDIETHLQQLVRHVPLQYVLGEAWFAGLKLFVNPHVLIPRPETEELVEWIVQSAGKKVAPAILDIGTGSGCIALALKKKLPLAKVHGADVSAGALEVAAENAALNKLEISLQLLDVLDENAWCSLPNFNIIVSNPPYITHAEANDMEAHVLEHEPHTALFVPDNTPLLFYTKIADFGLAHLAQKGMLFFEINEAFGNETVHLLRDKGYTDVELRKDLQGKNRMVKAVLAG